MGKNKEVDFVKTKVDNSKPLIIVDNYVSPWKELPNGDREMSIIRIAHNLHIEDDFDFKAVVKADGSAQVVIEFRGMGKRIRITGIEEDME